MLPDRVSNPGPLTYKPGALPIALRGPAPSSVTLTINLPEQMFQMAVPLLKENKCDIHCIILRSMHKCRSYGPDKLNYDHIII